jgi:chloride channel protein, CIC family
MGRRRAVPFLKRPWQMVHLLKNWLRPWGQLTFDRAARIYLYSALVGLACGLAAAAFTLAFDWTSSYLSEAVAGYPKHRSAGEINLHFFERPAAEHSHRLWVLVLLPALGALLGGYLVERLAPEARGAGTDAVIDAFHNGRARIRPIVAPVKALSAILTLSSGGSAGKQGPLAQIGAALGAWIGTALRLPLAQRRILLLAGMAGGLGAIFRAPLGGAITSVEVLYREDFESDALIPCVISSMMAYSVYMGFFGFGHVFAMPDFLFTDVRELALYLVLGVFSAMVGIFYVRLFDAMRRFFEWLPGPRWVVAGFGGGLVGLLALIDVRVLGTGFGVLQESIEGNLGLWTFLLLVGLKILATACTVGSGAAGGVFGPALFIGGMLGGAVGLAGQALFPGVVQQPAAYIVVGMASFFAGVANAPLGAFILVTEMTGSYHLLPPLMLVCAFALIFTRGFSIYKRQVQDRFHSPAHLKDFTIDVLQDLEVGQVFERIVRPSEALVRNDTPYFTLRALSRRIGQVDFVVVDEQSRLRGMLHLDELDLLEDDALSALILAEDLNLETVDPVLDTDDLHVALQKLLDSGYDKLPVVSTHEVRAGATGARGEGGEVWGYLMYQDLLLFYDKEVERLKRDSQE